jgi:hypothetical protein
MGPKATGRQSPPVQGQRPDDAEERSLDLVQRMVNSPALCAIAPQRHAWTGSRRDLDA